MPAAFTGPKACSRRGYLVRALLCARGDVPTVVVMCISKSAARTACELRRDLPALAASCARALDDDPAPAAGHAAGIRRVSRARPQPRTDRTACAVRSSRAARQVLSIVATGHLRRPLAAQASTVLTMAARARTDVGRLQRDFTARALGRISRSRSSSRRAAMSERVRAGLPKCASVPVRVLRGAATHGWSVHRVRACITVSLYV